MPRPADVAPNKSERELKFALTGGRAIFARQWLEQFCRRDPEFPEAIVWTVYYDTPGLVSLAEKLNSDYLKRKMRVRWYSGLDGPATGAVFIEAKFRVGNRRSKVRARLSVDAAELAEWDLRDRRWLRFPLYLQEHGVDASGLWRPVMLIRYRRDRFIEPVSGSRISLDSDIAAVKVNPSFVSRVDYSPLGGAVLEVKGAQDELPVPLQPFLRLGARKASVSKLLAVYAHMTGRAF